MKFLLAIVLVLLMVAVPAQAKNSDPTDVYAYKIDEGFDIDAIHARVLETGMRDIAIEVGLYSIATNSGATPEMVLDEIEWVKSEAHAKTIWVIDYMESTRMGYEDDGVYRYYRLWESRLDAYRAIARDIDYFIVVVGEMHYPARSDITTYLLALKGIFEPYGVQLGVYDGDGVRDILNYGLLEQEDIFIWSDIYMADPPYLRSPNGWDNLVTLCYIGIGNWQFNEPSDFQAASDLMIREGFTGYNIIETYSCQGILP